MGSDDRVSGDEMTPEQLEEIHKELALYEKQLNEFRIVGTGMSGNPTDGFEYDPDAATTPTVIGGS